MEKVNCIEEDISCSSGVIVPSSSFGNILMKLRVLIFIYAMSFSCAQARETMIIGQIRDKLSGTFVSM
ncbi:MAG TPA: hypothetical protein DEQ84_07445, partial [Prevotellaceae bacterium]|nr:hypothetical protein [Prevotellaceae bacterium]